ncbi:hypothetical protein [Bradyrhizobium sp. CCBAU 11361]|uniref:hypothetical protein n=1 Tax=Bradyrhizobium sp. CCBAU 11361 TaxID=1630812 RepID=UPI002302074A|nr:hypothetical protein [Bradyrhizobium sp. CCBAU 11361]
MKTSKKDTQAPLLDLVEVCADGTSLGKSTLANRICHLYRETGRPVTRVRIESSRRREHDSEVADREIFVPLEDFTTAATRTGGLVGVLSPMFEAILQIPRSGSAVVVDWPGGTAGHRLEVLAATAFDQTINSLNVRALSMVLTTCSSEHMGQAERHLKSLEQIAPRLPRALALSGRAGPFDWPAGSEQAEALTRLKTAAGDIPTLRIPLVTGRALQVCADAGLDVASALLMNFDELAVRLGVHVFQASACVSEIALWWQRTGSELRKVLEVKHAGVPA